MLAVGLRAMLNAFGIDLPTTSSRFELRTVIVSLAVGVVVTLVSSFWPALKATRVPPVAAMREEAATTPARSIRRRSILGSVVTIFLGVAALSPLVARPLARWIGWPFARAFRLPGNLARENAMRNPRRTASTAAALMIGVALQDTVARQHGWKVGSVVPMEFPRNGVQREPVMAIYKSNSLNGGYLLSLADYQKGYRDQIDSLVIAKARPGVDATAARAAVDRVAADFPNVRVQAQYKVQTGKQLDQLLNLVRGLLLFAIVIALFGIVNTLALSVLERVRERPKSAASKTSGGRHGGPSDPVLGPPPCSGAVPVPQ